MAERLSVWMSESWRLCTPIFSHMTSSSSCAAEYVCPCFVFVYKIHVESSVRCPPSVFTHSPRFSFCCKSPLPVSSIAIAIHQPMIFLRLGYWSGCLALSCFAFVLRSYSWSIVLVFAHRLDRLVGCFDVYQLPHAIMNL